MQPHDTPAAPAQHKTCCRCNETKPLREFHRNKSHGDGYHSACKKCRAEREGFRYKPPCKEGHRRCSACAQEFPATTDNFYVDGRYPEALSSVCKPCAKAGVADWAANNRERNREIKSRWAMLNPGKVQEAGQRYYCANRERLRLYYAENRDRFRDRKRKYNQEYVQKNPLAVLAKAARRRARKRRANGTHTAENIHKQYAAQKGKCYWCGVKVGETFHVDHVIPLSRGGSNGPENIVIACPACNLSKNDKLPTEWDGSNKLL